MFVDTNVLVAARFVNAPGHLAACRSLDYAGNSEEPLHISHQIVREYLVVVTRPQTWWKSLGMDDALKDATRLVSSFTVLEDGPNVMTALTGSATKFPSRASRSTMQTSRQPCWRMASGVCSRSTPRISGATENESSW